MQQLGFSKLRNEPKMYIKLMQPWPWTVAAAARLSCYLSKYFYLEYFISSAADYEKTQMTFSPTEITAYYTWNITAEKIIYTVLLSF